MKSKWDQQKKNLATLLKQKKSSLEIFNSWKLIKIVKNCVVGENKAICC